MLVYDRKQARVEDARKYLQAHVHERDPSPFVRVEEITTFWYGHNLAFLPFGKIYFFAPIRVEEVQQDFEVLVGKCFEGIRRYVDQPGGLSFASFLTANFISSHSIGWLMPSSVSRCSVSSRTGQFMGRWLVYTHSI